jgi:hypothetical protein
VTSAAETSLPATPAAIEYEAEWVPEAVWMAWKTEESLHVKWRKIVYNITLFRF